MKPDKAENDKKEGNAYDKIFKENIESVFLPLMHKYLGINIASLEIIEPKLQTTLELEADFLRLVKTVEGEEFILHLEFQTKNDRKMLFRFKEYDGIIQKKYKKEIRHYVIFLGKMRVSMKRKLPDNMIFKGFEVVNLSRLDYNEMISSQIPEEIILAILSDHKQEPPELIIRSIINKLRKTSKSEAELNKFIKQLGMLSRLRNLEEETRQTITAMPITYDIQNDGLYKEGLQVGAAIEAKKQEEKQQKKTEQLIISLLNEGELSIPRIASIFKVPQSLVRRLKKSLKKE